VLGHTDDWADSYDDNSADNDIAPAPGLEVYVTRSTQVTVGPVPFYLSGRNASFGGYGNDPRVGPLQRQLAADRAQAADERTHGHEQGL
jgi:hypothetical protein